MPEKNSENFEIKELADGRVQISFYYWYAGSHKIILENYDEFYELADLMTEVKDGMIEQYKTAVEGRQCDSTLSGSSPVPTSQNTPAKSITTVSATS